MAKTKAKNYVADRACLNGMSRAAVECVQHADRLLAWSRRSPATDREHDPPDDERDSINPLWELQLLLDSYARIVQYLPRFERLLARQSCGIAPAVYLVTAKTCHAVAEKLAQEVLEAVARALDSGLVVSAGRSGIWVADIRGWRTLLSRVVFVSPRPLETYAGVPSAPAPVRMGLGPRPSIRYRRADLEEWVAAGCPRVEVQRS